MMQPGQKKSHGGFTLIEVLVTLVILAVGLLGIASLQLKGAQFNHDAVLRSQISTLAYDIADRVRLAGSTLASNILAAIRWGLRARVVRKACMSRQQLTWQMIWIAGTRRCLTCCRLAAGPS